MPSDNGRNGPKRPGTSRGAAYYLEQGQDPQIYEDAMK